MSSAVDTPTATRRLDRFARSLRAGRIWSSLPKNECPHRRSDQLPDRCVKVPARSRGPDNPRTSESCCNEHRRDPSRHHQAAPLLRSHSEIRSSRMLYSTSVCRRELYRDTSLGSCSPTSKRLVVLEATMPPTDPV